MIVFITVCLTACGTVTRWDLNQDFINDCEDFLYEPLAYGGVYMDVNLLKQSQNIRLVPIVDLPLSAIADTLMLPFALFLEAQRKINCHKQISTDGF